MYTVNFAFAIFFCKAKMNFFFSSPHPYSLSHHFLRLVAIFTYTVFFTTQFFLSQKEAALTSTRIPRHLAFHFIDAKSLQNMGSDMQWWRWWWWWFFSSSSSTSVHTHFVFHLFALANWRKYRLSKRNISPRKVCNRYLLTYSKCMTVTFFFYSLLSSFSFSLFFSLAPLFRFCSSFDESYIKSLYVDKFLTLKLRNVRWKRRRRRKWRGRKYCASRTSIQKKSNKDLSGKRFCERKKDVQASIMWVQTRRIERDRESNEEKT